LIVGAVLALSTLAATTYLLVSSHRGMQPGHPVRLQTVTIISPGAYAPPATSTALAPNHEGLRVRIRELNIDLPVVEGDGYDAPLYKAAHYPGMPWPGEGGRSLIYAHARPGMFAPLSSARVGQHIQVVGPEGSARKYVITEYYPRWPITDHKWLRTADHDELVLLTCTTYNSNDPRIVVVGEPE
jgi:LPXTG-site transpeptidase (sortase) family protein